MGRQQQHISDDLRDFYFECGAFDYIDVYVLGVNCIYMRYDDDVIYSFMEPNYFPILKYIQNTHIKPMI